MTYFKINNVDFSAYVSSLDVNTVHNSKNRTNASGNLNVKYINTKKALKVGIIPLDNVAAASLLNQLNKFEVTVKYLDPETKQLETIECIVPSNNVGYYTIRADKVMTKAYTIKFTEK